MDIDQVEGAFIMGLGLWTIEKLTVVLLCKQVIICTLIKWYHLKFDRVTGKKISNETRMYASKYRITFFIAF